MQITRSDGDRVEITSLTGIAGSVPFAFTDDTGAPVNLSAVTCTVEIYNTSLPDLPPLAGDPAIVLTLTEGNGGITRNGAGGVITVSLTVARADALAMGGYGWRMLFFTGSECTDRPLSGRWVHQRGR